MIKHPYLGMCLGHYSVFFMEEKGQDLAEILKTSSGQNIRKEWKDDFNLRKAFYVDVGHSMWNLVSRLSLINNDLRLPNVTRSGNSFCLIDFDMCQQSVDYSFKASNIFKDLDFKLQTTMHLASLIQMTFIVFFLDSEEFDVKVRSAAIDEKSIRNYILKGKENSELKMPKDLFFKWLKTKRDIVRSLFESGMCCLIDRTNYFSILRSLLSLEED